MSKAYLQFGGAALGAPNGPFETVSVPVKETERPRKGQTVSGYGKAIPAAHKVLWAGRWHRVRVAVYGNAGTAYIGRPGAWIAVVSDIEMESTK